MSATGCIEDTKHGPPAICSVFVFKILDYVIALFPQYPTASAKDVNLRMYTPTNGIQAEENII